jgi:hypothetical protein
MSKRKINELEKELCIRWSDRASRWLQGEDLQSYGNALKNKCEGVGEYGNTEAHFERYSWRIDR